MKFSKDDIYSIIGSVAFHAVLLLVLLFTFLKTVVPDEDGGVLVNFGNVDSAAGTFEPQYTGQELPQETTTPPPAAPEPETTPAPAVKEELVTQDIEESVAIEETKKKKKEKEKEKEKAKALADAEAKKKAEQQKKAEEERQRKAEEERKRKEEAEKQRLAEEKRKKEQAISNRVAGAFGMGTASGTSQGTASSGTGNQGSPFGNSDTGANEGGFGSFNLNGRSIGAGGLPKPAYTIQEEGKIVISITVDPKGNVIFAEIGKGTNIDNDSMRKSAIEAAKKAKFNEITGTNNQSGTITYVYKLK